jgi:hypothetical protein
MLRTTLFCCGTALAAMACGDDDGNEADAVGIAATCAATADCPRVPFAGADECLTQFTDGYCGLPDCTVSADCPQGAICVLHDDGATYCFRECLDKPECNRNRPPEAEANCSSSFDFNDPADDVGQKACIPPSSGV